MQRLYNILSIVAIFVLAWFFMQTCEGKKRAEKINEQSKDSVTIFKDKYNREHAVISVLEGSVSDLKNLNSTKDSSLKKLQALVDKKTRSAIVFNTTTHNNGSSPTTVITTTIAGEHHITFDANNNAIDSADINLVPCPVLTYSTEVNDTWFKGTITASKDSIRYKLKTFNEYNIKETYAREKFWKEKQGKVEITNLNPNTSTTDVKMFKLANPKLRRGFIFIAGVVVGGVGTLAGVAAISKLLP